MAEEDDAPAFTLRDLIGSDADDEDAEAVPVGKKKRARNNKKKQVEDADDHEDGLPGGAGDDDDDDDDASPPSKKRQRLDADGDADGEASTTAMVGTCFGMQRKLVESMLTFKIPPDLKRKLQHERVDTREANRSWFAESHRIFIQDVIQGLCLVSSSGGGCERCAISASFWISGEHLDRKVNRSCTKGVIYEAFRTFYNDAEKLPDLTGINWHNFVISDVLRFSDIQFRPTFYLAADIVELLCANRCFVQHLNQPRLGRRLADFLLFALQFHATENALRQIGNRLLPEIRRLGLQLPTSIPSLRDSVRSPARSIRKKRIMRYLKQLVQFVLESTQCIGTKSQRCILLTRIFLLGLRRPG